MPLSRKDNAARMRRIRAEATQTAQDRHTAALAEIRSKGPLRFIESLIIPPGNVRAGKPMTLGLWQKTFIERALESKQALLCCARKNSKSFTCAAIALWHVLSIDAARCIVASLTIEHAVEIQRFIKTLCQTNAIEVDIQASPRPGNFTFPNGSEIVFVSGNPYGAPLSSQASLVLVDEIGVFPGSKRPLVANLKGCLSLSDGRFIALSIRGDSVFIPEIIDQAKDDESVYVQMHEGDPAADILDEANWHQSNPGLAQGIKSISWMRRESRQAKGNPAAEQIFRSLHLNENLTSDRVPIIDLTSWKAVTERDLPDRTGPVIVGVDLGSGQNSFCSAAYLWPDTGRAESFSIATGDLIQRGRRDGVGQTYLVAQRQGELVVQDSNAVDIAAFMQLVKEHLEGERVLAVYSDRYRQADMADALQRCRVTAPLVPVGQGFREGSELVRAFQSQVATGSITHRPSVLLALAIGQSYLVFDPAGNPKLDKRRSHSKTDQLVALMHACLGATRYEQAKPKRRRRRHFVV